MAEHVQDFARLAAAEWREKVSYFRAVAIAIALSLLLGLMSIVLLSFAITAGVARLIGSWGWALLIVGVVYGIAAGVLLIPALRTARTGALRFQRISEQIQKDREWVKEKLAA